MPCSMASLRSVQVTSQGYYVLSQAIESCQSEHSLGELDTCVPGGVYLGQG